MKTPTPIDVVRAAERIRSHVVRTPLLSIPAIDELIAERLLVKAESLQRTGSFKLRGAYNRLLQLSAAERTRGVVAWSAGNHGQALAPQ
ncbi:MAG: pyridoxal-phosphate dependent enzyme [Gammaproteobacteria bacterium]|nr:pyridoxal-phosphate dependent enzyme [Gammaproteobacteria bacterium]